MAMAFQGAMHALNPVMRVGDQVAERLVVDGLSKRDVEHILANPDKHTTSKSSGLPAMYGHTPEGEYAFVVYEEIDDDTIRPVTAYLV